MAKGVSGRVVVQIQPSLKRELHSALAMDGQTLKSWFIEAANHYIARRTVTNSPVALKPKKQDTKTDIQ
jgi:hypothetical protein